MEIAKIAGGGSPILGEPLPLELANTTYAERGRLRDGLHTAQHLTAWLRDIRARLRTPLTDADLLAVNDTHLAMARDLRDSIRQLAQAAAQDSRPDSAPLDALNRGARTAPRWQELRWANQPHAKLRSNADPLTAALSEIAEAAVELFAGPQHTDVRTCGAPGCVLYFLKNHPRREWCSPGCGNRVRAARHYQRTRRPS